MSDINSNLSEKLTGPVSAILEKHQTTIIPMLGNGATALRNDEAVRKVAGYCYLLLPGLLGLAIREPVFVDFVLSHRERLLERLVAPESSVTGS